MRDASFHIISECSPNERQHPIRPDDFHLEKSETFLSTFGKCEIEIAARRLIAFFQSRGYWCEFSIDELRRFYGLKGWDYNTMFFGLTGAWYDDGGFGGNWREPLGIYLAFSWNGRCNITDQFIDRCARNLKKKVA